MTLYIHKYKKQDGLFSYKSLYYKELFCTFAIEIGYGGGDTQSPRLLE